MRDQMTGPKTILISSASVGFANLIADFLRKNPSVDKVVVPGNAHEMLSILEHEQFDLHLVGGGSIDFYRSVKGLAADSGRAFHRSGEMTMMLNGPDPFRVLLARQWGTARVIDMRLTLEEIVTRMLAPRHSPLWNEDTIANYRLDSDPGAPTVDMICRDAIDLAIIEGIVEGLSDPEIAERVNYAVQSVRNRVSRILAVSQSRNRTHFAVRMLRASSVRRTGT